MDLQARKPIFIFLTALLLMAMASACTTRSISGSQTSFPGAQLSIPEPTSIQLSTVELGTVTQYLSPELWGLLYQQVTEETVPERVSVMIYENKVDTTPGLSDYITAAGGTSSDCCMGTAKLTPLRAFRTTSQQPGEHPLATCCGKCPVACFSPSSSAPT